MVISDLPFGKRIGSKTDNRKLYPAILKEFARVIKPGSGRACLLTQVMITDCGLPRYVFHVVGFMIRFKDKRTILRALDTLHEFWSVKRTMYINIGGLTAGLFLLQRTKNAFQLNPDQPPKSLEQKS